MNGPKPVCKSPTKKFTMSSARALRAWAMSEELALPGGAWLHRIRLARVRPCRVRFCRIRSRGRGVWLGRGWLGGIWLCGHNWLARVDLGQVRLHPFRFGRLGLGGLGLHEV